MAFTGFATYDDQNTIQSDIVDRISVVVPQFKILSTFDMSPYPAENTVHYWNQEKLSPGTIIASTEIASATAATGFQINGVGARLQTGDLLEFVGADSIVYNEQLQITSVAGANSILCSRGVGSVGPSSLAAGGTLTLIGNAALEGGDYDSDDISRNSSQKENTVQIFAKPIRVSDTQRNVSHYGIPDMIEHQKQNRLNENLRDFEYAFIRGVDSQTIGSNSAYRRMGGLWREITTNVATFSTISASNIDEYLIKPCIEADFEDLDVLLLDPDWSTELANEHDSRIQVTVQETTYGRRVKKYMSALLDRELDVVTSLRLMPKSAIVTSKQRAKMVNLQGASFRYEDLAKTGRSTKGHVVGQYTAEFWHEYGMSKAYSS